MQVTGLGQQVGVEAGDERDETAQGRRILRGVDPRARDPARRGGHRLVGDTVGGDQPERGPLATLDRDDRRPRRGLDDEGRGPTAVHRGRGEDGIAQDRVVDGISVNLH